MESSEAASAALDVNNNALNTDIDLANLKIEELKNDLDRVRIKQQGIIPGNLTIRN